MGHLIKEEMPHDKRKSINLNREQHCNFPLNTHLRMFSV